MLRLSMRFGTLLLLAVLMLAVPATANDDCEGCKRAGVLDKCTANDPMGIVIQPGGLTAEQARQQSTEGNRILTEEEAYCRSVRSRLSELFLRDCFSLVNAEIVQAYRDKAAREGWDTWIKPPDYKIPEYTFEADFVSGLEGLATEEGRPIRSRLTITMYFDGEQKEFVHRWQTDGTWDVPSNSGTSWLGHGSKLGKAYKDGPDMVQIIDEFEKRPDNCRMRLEEEVVKPGQIVDIELTDFVDAMGEPSREFNRIVLQVQHGKILNGMPSKYSYEMRVFQIGKEPLKVKYQAPDTCYASSDSLFISSACEILPDDREPLEDTEIDEKIQTEPIPLFCPGVFVVMTHSVRKHTEWNIKEQGKVDRHNWDENTSVSVRVDFEDTPDEVRQTVDMATMTTAPDRYRYKPARWTINSSSHSGNGGSMQKRESAAGLEYLLESTSSQSARFFNLQPTQEEIMMTIDVDPATGRATSISIPAYEMDVTYTVNKKCTKKERRTVDGFERVVTDDCSDNWNHDGDFSVGHGEDECWEITGGDGISSISGGCRRTINRDNGYVTMEFNWSVTIKTDSK